LIAAGRIVRPPASFEIGLMVDEPDIWRAADLLVKRHGADAVVAVSAPTLLG
jgi:hypothetical protein